MTLPPLLLEPARHSSRGQDFCIFGLYNRKPYAYTLDHAALHPADTPDCLTACLGPRLGLDSLVV